MIYEPKNISVNAYKHTSGNWVKTKEINKKIDIEDLYKLSDELDIHTFFLPKDTNLNNCSELVTMEKLALKYMTNYLKDFYLHDARLHIEQGQSGLWLLRKTGTDYISAKQLPTMTDEVYEYYLNLNDSFYIVEKNSVKQLSKENALAYIKEVRFKSPNL